MHGACSTRRSSQAVSLAPALTLCCFSLLPPSVVQGSSGAGKTTLLDVLGQRKSTGTVTGTVRLNGRLMGAGDRAGRVLAYGEQADHHFPLSTVQESIEFSAHLRLSSSVTADQRRSFVSNILRELELRHLAGRLVNTLTAGEKKRLTIGVELASNAPILFLSGHTRNTTRTHARTHARELFSQLTRADAVDAVPG